MPISAASRLASSNSPAGKLLLTPVTATARSPSANCAALATTLLSTPAENATAQLGSSPSSCSSRSRLASSPDMENMQGSYYGDAWSYDCIVCAAASQAQ